MDRHIRMEFDTLKKILEDLQHEGLDDSWVRLTDHSDSLSNYLNRHKKCNAEYDLKPISVAEFEAFCANLRRLIECKNKGEDYTGVLRGCLHDVDAFRSTP